MIAKDPADLSKEELVKIVCSARDFLFFGEFWEQGDDETTGRIVEDYSLNNDVSGADFVEHMNCVFSNYGLTPTEDLVADLVAKVEGSDKYQEIIDDLVHDCVSQTASAINNEGPSGQIDYLLGHGLSKEDILVELE